MKRLFLFLYVVSITCNAQFLLSRPDPGKAQSFNEAFMKCEIVTKLNVVNNSILCSITEVPKEIAYLPNLISVSLIRLPIIDLPKELIFCKNIKEVDVSESNISSIPIVLKQICKKYNQEILFTYAKGQITDPQSLQIVESKDNFISKNKSSKEKKKTSFTIKLKPDQQVTLEEIKLPKATIDLCLKGDFNSGQGEVLRPNGNKFVGEGVNGMFSKGKMYHTNGDLYEGSFSNNKRNGKGKYNFAFGHIYIGDFLNDKFEGTGTFILPSGECYYKSTWIDDKRVENTGRYFNSCRDTINLSSSSSIQINSNSTKTINNSQTSTATAITSVNNSSDQQNNNSSDTKTAPTKLNNTATEPIKENEETSRQCNSLTPENYSEIAFSLTQVGYGGYSFQCKELANNMYIIEIYRWKPDGYGGQYNDSLSYTFEKVKGSGSSYMKMIKLNGK